MKVLNKSFLDILNGFARDILLISKDGNIVFCSAQTYKLLDYEPGSLLQRNIMEVNPNFSLLGWKKFWRTLKTDNWSDQESELISSAGIIFPVFTKARLWEIEGEAYCCYIYEDHRGARQFEKLLALTSKISRIGSWSLDLLSDTVSFTADTARLLGLQNTGPDHQISSTRFFRFLKNMVDISDWSALYTCLKKAIYEGTPFELELGGTIPGGVHQRFNIHTLVQYSEGMASQIYGTIQDISTLVERSEDMYMAEFTVDHAKEMIFWITQDGTINFANEQVRKKLGYTRREVLNLKAFDLSPDFPEEIWEEHWENVRENKVLEVETTLRRKDGTLFPISATILHLVYKGIEYNCSFVRDLSMKKQRDELIHLTQHTIDQSHDLILWLNAEGQIFFSNQTARDTLGYSEAKLSKLLYKDLYEKGEKQQSFSEIWEELKDVKELVFDQKLRKKSGKELPVEATATLLQFQGKDCLCVTMRNLTEKAKKEAQLRRAYEEIKHLKEKIEGEKTYLQEEVSSKYSFNNIITKSPRYRQVLRQLSQVADTDATVLILGETGTGKELLARAIHGLSNRDDQPLVKVNCAALPENLIESELFGHEKGAFTGAYQRKIGRFELADGGTIFLDEIGEMPIELQSKLLRVLQEGELQRLGSMDTKKVDVRVVAATNRDLEQQVAEGKFREDLFYRLNVFPIRNLPLRERKDDIPLLVNHFVKKFTEKTGRKVSKIPAAGVNQLLKYEFPGNVRVLENIIERAVVVSRGDTLDLDAVLPSVMKSKPTKTTEFLRFEEMQKQHIVDALVRTQWKVTGAGSASELLGMNGKTLASKMRKLGIVKPQISY